MTLPARRNRKPRRPLPRVGPWSRDDYRSFRRLCIDALLATLPEPDAIIRGLAAWQRARRTFPDVSAAEKAIADHAVYRWLKKTIPRAVDPGGDSSPFVRLRRLHILVHSLPSIGARDAKPIRVSPLRETAIRAAQRLQQSIIDGVLHFPNAGHEEVFEELLEETIQILQQRAPRRRSKSVKYPALQALAHELYEKTGAVDVQLLIEIAGACNLNCDERTVRRYLPKGAQLKDKSNDR